jgi:hypothetical protein
VRLDAYERRKQAQLKEMEQTLLRLSNKCERFIHAWLMGFIDLRPRAGRKTHVVRSSGTPKFDGENGAASVFGSFTSTNLP